MIKLGEICDIKGGKRLPKGCNFTENKTDHPYIRARDIRDGIIANKGLEYIDEDTFNLIKNYIVNTNDVCITVAGNIGDVGIVSEELAGANLTENAVKITNLKNYDPKFILFYLLMPKLREEMQKLAAGAAQPKLGIYKIKEIYVPELDIKKQRKIAEIISKYDDLIKNNSKRIKILEESAELIYKEWFINFRFPGYEECKFVDGVPKGWSKKKLKEVCKINMGQSPKSEFYNEDKMGLPFHQGVTDFGDRFPTNNKYCTVLKRLAESGDILFSVRAPVGRLNISTEKIIIGRGLAAIRNYKEFQSFQYYQLNNIFYKDNLIGGGTIFASITKNQLEDFEVMWPNDDVVNRFERYANKIDKQIRNLFDYNRLLKESRDILIPKLINREIEV